MQNYINLEFFYVNMALVEQDIMHELGAIKKVVVTMKEEVDFIKERFEDRVLSDDDKVALDETFDAHKKGTLASMKDVFD
jgi:hypothetical protein